MPAKRPKTTSKETPDRGDGRDPKGRFTTGNPGGPGNPQALRSAQYRAAIRDAVQPDHLRLVFQKMLQRAIKDGDVHAARLVIDRCLGRADHDPLGEGIPIDFPTLETFSDILRVTETVLRAAIEGTASLEATEKIFGLLGQLRSVYYVEELDRRITAMEESSES